MSFQILQFRIKCALPAQGILEISARPSGEVFSENETEIPETLFCIQHDGTLREESRWEIRARNEAGVLLWLSPEDEKRALWLPHYWKFLGIERVDLNSIPILPCPERRGIRLYHKGEILFCPAELVFREFLQGVR